MTDDSLCWPHAMHPCMMSIGVPDHVVVVLPCEFPPRLKLGKPLKDYEQPPPLFPLDEDEDSVSDEEGDSGKSEGEFDESRTQSGKGYQNEDDDDNNLYIPQPLLKAPPWHRSKKHPSKVIDVEEADDAPKEGIQLERWGKLPDIQESEGDDQSIDSLKVSEPDIDVPKAPTPQPAPSPAPPASKPTRERNPPDFLSPKMSGQYHGGEMTFTCDIYLVEIADNVSAFFDDTAFLLTLADKNTMTLKDALNDVTFLVT